MPFSTDFLGVGRRRYVGKLLGVSPGNLIGYWPMWESEGAVSVDYSGQANVGAYTGVTLGQPGIGDGRTCPLFDGANDFNNIYSAGLAADFNGAEGTLVIWAKASAAGVWTDTNSRRIARLAADGNNQIQIWENGSGSLVWDHTGGGTLRQRAKGSITATDWLHLAIVWSVAGGFVRAFYQGVQEGADLGAPGTWAGSLAATLTVLGASNTTPASVWSGWEAHAALWNKALPDAPAALARVG